MNCSRTFDKIARQAIRLKCVAAAMKVKAAPAPRCNPLPSVERLQELFEYRAETGELINRVQRGGLKVGEPAGLKQPDRFGGYIVVYVDCKGYRAHRIIWKMVTGRDPEGHIDHKDGDRSNNRFANLRDVLPLENSRNRHAVSGKVPYRGISICPQSGAYASDIGIGGRVVHLGMYDALECAIAARQFAERIAYHFPVNGRAA